MAQVASSGAGSSFGGQYNPYPAAELDFSKVKSAPAKKKSGKSFWDKLLHTPAPGGFNSTPSYNVLRQTPAAAKKAAPTPSMNAAFDPSSILSTLSNQKSLQDLNSNTGLTQYTPTDDTGPVSDMLSSQYPTAPAAQQFASALKLADYISKYKNFGIDDIEKAFGGQRKQAQSTTKSGQANLGALYSALAKTIRGDADTLATKQTDLQDASKDATAQNQQALTQAFVNAKGQTQDELSQLGIADAGADSMANSAQYQNMNQSGSTATGNAATQRLIEDASGQAQQANANVTAAGLEGASRQSDLGDQLQSYLSQLGTQQTQQEAQTRQNNLGLAQSMYSTDADAERYAFEQNQAAKQQDYQNSLQKWQADQQLDDTAWDRSFQQAQFDQQNQQDALSTAMDQANSSTTAAPTKGVDAMLNTLSNSITNPGTRNTVVNQILGALNPQNGASNSGQASANLKKMLDDGDISPEEYSVAMTAVAQMFSQQYY